MPTVEESLRRALAPDFTVERKIATGGMGTVWLGRDERLGRAVAIKTLRPELATAVAVERFLREAQYLARLNHPNILRVHTADERDGLVFYVMDHVEGDTLEARLARGRMSLAETVLLGQGLLAGLTAAHSKGLIHRDIKPSNIFLVGGRPVLGDFGIARTTSAEDTKLTRSGSVIGTQRYMAPEQAAGREATTRSDLYSAGLVLFEACTGRHWEWLARPEDGDWAGVPEPLVEVLWTALEPDPAKRWSDAAGFSRALAGESASRVRWAHLIPLSALAIYLAVHFWPRDPQPQVVAVFPFETVGLADTTLGDQLARITASYLEALPGLNVAPVRTTFREWRESRLPPADRLAQLSGGIGAKYGVWSIVRPAQGGVEAKLHVMDAGGHSLLETIVRGDPADPQGLGDSIVLQLVTKVFPGTEPIYRGGSGLSGRNPRAVREFLFGEDASERGAWLTAERHYQDALALDSTFLLAAWRLANVRRWMPWRRDPPLPVNFLRSYEAYGARLAAHERLLIDAQFAPAGKPRFELYEKALRRRPRDAYPALFYGDELFHRGPLSGRPRGDAIVTLQRAVELDSSLAPAHEHLAWALIRSGRKEEARRSLDALQRTAGHSGESEVHLPIFLELAYALRFAPDSSLLDHPALQSPTGLSLAARGALSVDLPELEAELGARLSKLRAAPRVLHGSGQIAQGLARMAQGRPGDAVAHFDSAISLVADSNEARLQSAEWRIVPAALGLPGIPSSETQAARRQLEGWTGDTAVILRAAWVLAMDALAQGDTLQAAPLIERVWALAGAGGPFAMQLSAMRSAAAGRLEEALRLSEPALAFDSAGRAGDPFFRSTLHLQRGHWYAALGRPNLADAAWLWYEALDLVGWPDGVAQAGEVDWALGTYARLARSRLTAGKPDRQSCALLAEVVANWRKPEPAYAPLVAEARRRLAQCPQ